MSVFLLKYPRSLAPNIKKHCTPQYFVLGFLNLIFERYKKFQKVITIGGKLINK